MIRAACALALLGVAAGCSFRGGDFAPLAKEPETECSRAAEAFCNENLGSADLATCIKRETYRCELLEEQGAQPEPQP